MAETGLFPFTLSSGRVEVPGLVYNPEDKHSLVSVNFDAGHNVQATKKQEGATTKHRQPLEAGKGRGNCSLRASKKEHSSANTLTSVP